MYKLKTSDFFNNTVSEDLKNINIIKDLKNINIIKDISQESFISKYSALYAIYSLQYKIEFSFKRNGCLHYIMIEDVFEDEQTERKTMFLEYEDDIFIFNKEIDEIERNLNLISNNNIIKIKNIELYFSDNKVDSIYYFSDIDSV